MSDSQADANRQQVEANTLRQQAETVRTLTDIGFDKTAAVNAVKANDLSMLTNAE